MERPEAAERIELFANTFDLESGRDDLADAERLRQWLVRARLIERTSSVGDEEHRMCLELRAGIREVLSTEGPHEPHRLAAAEVILEKLPVLVSFTGSSSTVAGQRSGAVLVPATGLAPVHRACALLALDWATLVMTGQARRLKRCAEHSCLWVFWDGSKNQSRRWCSMKVCGNRTKSRRHNERSRRPRTPAALPPGHGEGSE
ncbi:hypothetical protein GCM10007079_26020 [Nocardiopsis terrae]|uniref:CGNR zinc finger domain-containing protein n=1 Tax=Nocardiopsis terrae TaxID=372655 RepID=UPI00174E1431|nr:hypothetical protein GCM10007079_26020 [Nocardiopsis terrae]